MKYIITNYGAPPSRASRLIFALLVGLCAGPLFADGPDAEVPNWLGKAKSALETGDSTALEHAAKALKLEPTGVPENRQMALAMFWAGHFEDAARYMRRALAAEPNALMDQPSLAELMPADDAQERLNQLALKTEKDSDLCFLTGTLLLINDDRPRALAFLVRGAELAGTDGQAENLIGDENNRSELRAMTALADGDYSEAQRSFTFAALDSPTTAEFYTGLAIALAAAGNTDTAVEIASNVYARCSVDRLMPWLHDLETRGDDLTVVARRLTSAENVPLAAHKLAVLLFAAADYWSSARAAGVQALLHDKLDNFTHDVHQWLDENGLKGDPQSEESSSPEQPDSLPEEDSTDTVTEPTLEAARKHIRKAEFTVAYKILDKLLTKDAEPEVFHLLFVVLVGRGELTDAAAALQTWFLRVDDAERMRLNAVRELFGQNDLWNTWRKHITEILIAAPNDGIPRLLNAYVEVTRGSYSRAREDLVVAEIESPGNRMVQTLDLLLNEDDYANDVSPDGVPDDPSPRALFSRADSAFRSGDYVEARTLYLKAMEADPDLPLLREGLLRCYFALGEYDEAYREMIALLDEEDMLQGDRIRQRLKLTAGYANTELFNEHLTALKKHCFEGGVNNGAKLDAEPWALYGTIQLEKADYKEAANALQKAKDFVLAPAELHPSLTRMLEYAQKRS